MLKVKDLEVFYGKIQALQRVNINIEEGEVVVLLGANGSGKSTILRAISGIVDNLKGEISFLGSRIDSKRPEAIVAFGIIHVPEGRQIFSELTVYENVIIGSYARKDRKTINEDLERVYTYFPRLFERKKQIAGTLSGGEQQMLAIARGLMGKPRLLMLDEPSLGLAPKFVEEIFEIIKKINSEGTTVLLVEQNAEMALSIADYGYVMEVGRVVFEGEKEILHDSEALKVHYLGLKYIS